MKWWSPKHNMHHFFTNSQLYDEDIKHDYKIYLYPFLYFKWRYDSLMTAFANKDLVTIYFIQLEIACLMVNYSLLFYCRENLAYFVISLMIGGFYSAHVLIGNH